MTLLLERSQNQSRRWSVERVQKLESFRPFRRPLSQKTGPATRSSYWLVTVAAGCAAARCILDLSTYPRPRRVCWQPRDAPRCT